MRLTFPNADLIRLLEDATAKWPKGTRANFGQKEPAPPGFWLVGDEGVYLMHNGMGTGEGKAVVVYAKECDPTKLAFDDWWGAKQATFGGDDGVEYLEPAFLIDAITRGDDIAIEFSANSFELISVPRGKKGRAH
jgi:hypothetical protein